MNFFRKISRRDSGFTLMELMIVMVILGILVTIAAGSYTISSRRGRDNRRKNDLRSLSTALEAYYSDKGRYPTGSNGVVMGCGIDDLSACNWGDEFQDQYGTLYMVVMPSDPSPTQQYYYASNGNWYAIYAKLENTLDQGDGVDQNGYDDPSSGAATDCSQESSIMCTYGIASGNRRP